MTGHRSPFSRRLYLRIWLAVVGGVTVFTLIVGYAWRVAAKHNAQQAAEEAPPPPRELELLTPDGRILLKGHVSRLPGNHEEGIDYRIETEAGESWQLHMSPRARPPTTRERERREVAFWMRPPYGFFWMLGLVGLAVTVGVFPIIRKLMQRLETLRRSVQRFGEGDLSVRVTEQGHDEVADLARQFNAAAARIQALVQSHKSLLANASHELRSPLTRICMGLELMGRGAPSAEFRREIERNISELDQLVDEILLASRLDAGADDVGDTEMVDLLGLAIEECVRVDAELRWDALAPSAGDAALELPGIAKLLRRAVRNLLENAQRYSSGDITLNLECMDGYAVLRVCDRGPGVSPDQRERIFEPFYRLPGASERAGGVGLGLSLVRSIAQRHGGSAYCEARPDGMQGACFVLRLPLGSVPVSNASRAAAQNFSPD